MACASLSTLQDAVRASGLNRVDPAEALQLMRHTLALKRKNDPKFRGRIPLEVSRLVSESVLDHLSHFAAVDLVTLVIGVGDCDKCVDEYLMYRIARIAEARLSEFTLGDLVRVAQTYSKRDLEDEALLLGIADVINASESSLSQKVSVLRSLSTLRIRHLPLIHSTVNEMAASPKIHEKDAISLLISLADLDVHEPELACRLWASVDSHKLSISRDDEYGLLFAALWHPTSVSVIDKIVQHARSQNRIRKRIQLLADGIHYGLIHREPVADVPPSAIPKERVFRKSANATNEVPGAISSGLHYEVANALKSMGFQAQLEVPVSSFTVDTILHR